MNGARRGPGLGASLVMAVLFIGVALASGLIPFRQVFAQEESLDLAISQRNALAAENLRLEQQVAALQTPAEVERLAREQFGLVLPGEIAFVAVPVEDTAADLAVPFPVFEERVSWWDRLWDFITGRDLGGDERP